MNLSTVRPTAAASLAFVAFTYLPSAWAQGTGRSAGSGAANGRPVATALRIAEPPTIDGFLDEEIWQRATPLMDFVQAEPLEGQPASEKTEVRVLYDNLAIFVGVRLHDTDPSQIVTTEARRDSGLGDQDSFQI